MSIQFQTLEQSFQTFILQLYRQWYGLPRKSTQSWLDAERITLANQLRQDDPAAAVRRFVDAAARRPGVGDCAASELTALRSSVRNKSLARITPQGVDTLATLLTVDDPVAHAFARWVYLSGRVADTLAQARARLNDEVLARLPYEERAAIAAIFTILDTTLDEVDASAPDGADAPFISQIAGPRRQAMIEALESLEQLPAARRIAWRALLAGKAQKETKTLGVGEASAAALFPQAAALDPTSATSTTALESSFYTDVSFPARVGSGDETPLTVRLTLERSDDSRVDEVIGVRFPDPAKPEMVDVVLDAPGFSERFDLWHRTMIVYSNRDSEPVTFLLTAAKPPARADRAPLSRPIKVSFYHGGKYIGEGSFTVEVGRDTRTSSRSAALEEDAARIELRLVDLPPPADLELRVTHDVSGQELHFMLHSTKAAVGYHWRRMGSVKLLEGKPQRYFSRQLEQLNEWGGLAPSDLYGGEEAEFTRKMANMGEELFETLFSPELRNAYWRDIRIKQQAGIIQSLLITSDEPWIPWELVKPYRYDDVADEEDEDDFLAHSFQISRWLTGHGPYERVTVDSATVVTPDVGLFHASGEADYLQTLRQHGVSVGEGLQTKREVIEALQEGTVHLLHVASHADFNPEHPDASPIVLNDDDLLPEDLDRHVIRRWRSAKPLIFFNACETGRIEYELTGLGGWADKFIRDVRATAFLGTLWKVNDALAADFAKVFYDELLAGEPLGVACHRARTRIRELAPANPTWLAYTLYGDPNTLVDWGSRDS